MKRLALIACLTLTFCALSSSAYAQEKPVGKFSGQWNLSFIKDGIPGSGGGSIRITVHPDDTFFTCKVTGSVSGTGKKGKAVMKVKSSMTSSNCRGSYNPENGFIDGSFTANETMSAVLTRPNAKPKKMKKSNSWAGSIRGKIADTAGEGFWADDEGNDAGWRVSGSFTGGEEETAEKEEKEEAKDDEWGEDEWDSFETEYEKKQAAMEVRHTFYASWQEYVRSGGNKDFVKYLEQEIPDDDTFIKVAEIIVVAQKHLDEQQKKQEKRNAKAKAFYGEVNQAVKSYNAYFKVGGKKEPEQFFDEYVKKNIKDPKKKKAVRKILAKRTETARIYRDPLSSMALAGLAALIKADEALDEKRSKEKEKYLREAEKSREKFKESLDESFVWTEGDNAKESKNYRQIKKIQKNGQKNAKKIFKRRSKADKKKQIAGWTNLSEGLSQISGGTTELKGQKNFEKNLKYNANDVLVKKMEDCEGGNKKACKSLDD